MKKTAVVALGGNALIKNEETGTIEEQEKHAYKTCLGLTKLLPKYNLIITHGNGPQVGNILLRNYAGLNEYSIPQMPLDICVADSQGGLGYMIEKEMMNALTGKNIKKSLATVVTQVLVEKSDPAFDNPTKPIGPYYPKEKAKVFMHENSWQFREDPRQRGWRRVVASPEPKEIINKAAVKELVQRGYIVIAGGGGGIPVFRRNKKLSRAEAVIDKDLASALLASEADAEMLMIITDIPKVYLRFNKPNQKQLNKIKVNELEEHYLAGEFPPGSMGPKIKACIDFIKNGGKRAIITDSPNKKGTIITK